MEEKKVPALRFRGFDNAWEQRRVGEFLSISKVPGHTGLNAKKLTVKLWGKGIIEKTDKLSGSENTRYYVRYAGQFMYGKLDFLHAAFGIVPDDLDNYESTLDSPAFDLHNIDGKFLLERVTQKDFYLRNGMTANGSRKAKRVHEDVFLNMDLVVTSYQEQEIIGKFFNKFDHLISLHQRKLEMLKKIKKSMLEKMFPKNDAKVPELRFSDFTDAWEQKELGELFSYLQNNTLSRAELNDNYGVAQSIHYGDVLIKYGECLDVSKERLAFIEKQSIADKFKTAYLQDGDIIVADTAEDGTVGKCTEIQDLTDKKIISGLHTIPLRPDQKFASGYLGFYMNSNSYHDQLKPLMQGIKVTSISKSAIQNTVVRYPFSLKEQGLVSRYLCLLNTLISLHQRKLEKLKNIKKSMLEKMFII